MKLSRRSFLAASAAGVAGAVLPEFTKAASFTDALHAPIAQSPAAAGGGAKNQGVKGRPKLCLSTYSLQNFANEPDGIERVILAAADIGVEAVDVLHRSMYTEDNDYIHNIKQMAYMNGVALACLSIHQDFVDPDPAQRQRMVDHTIRCIELAYKMGIPAIRLNSGSWGTAGQGASYRDRVNETPIAGYTNDDGFGWIQECIYKCIPTCEQTGITMALENHWGLSALPEGMWRIKNSVKSRWLKFLLDTGNFLEEPYDKIASILPECAFLSCKTYQGGGNWYELDLDYDRIFRMFHEVGFRGYITLEFEGKADRMASSIESLSMFKRYIDKYYVDTVIK
ncbi:MAG: sugar phosphate isomerase/epimerase [Alistipes sp.]|jgi:sugar phosphate isomerase/epimerase|nr:sugar phosphate isomerase/epimerase [Alistipes sp.]